ncbi:MAG TPA: hypothetical protein VE908_15825 [Mycobacterium sp.]|jgi:hypothetical protein|nr:hypothetical protein [Mycobacterium sp.]
MGTNVDVEPEWDASTAPSDRDAGPSGLATLADDGFGGGPSTPMLPNTWSPKG